MGQLKDQMLMEMRHCAGAAVRRFATNVGTGMRESLAQRMYQQFSRLNHDIDFIAVQLERHRLFIGHSYVSF